MNNVAADPEVFNVRVEKLFSDAYSGEGEYFGGHEGESLFSWYRDNDGTIDVIAGANSKTYEVTESDYNCRILFGYMFPQSFLLAALTSIHCFDIFLNIHVLMAYFSVVHFECFRFVSHPGKKMS